VSATPPHDGECYCTARATAKSETRSPNGIHTLYAMHRAQVSATPPDDGEWYCKMYDHIEEKMQNIKDKDVSVEGLVLSTRVEGGGEGGGEGGRWRVWKVEGGGGGEPLGQEEEERG